jgi:hypothetical protein
MPLLIPTQEQDGLALAHGCGLGIEVDPDWLDISGIDFLQGYHSH